MKAMPHLLTVVCLMLAGCVSGTTPDTVRLGYDTPILAASGVSFSSNTPTVAIVDGPLDANYAAFNGRIDLDNAWNLLTGDRDVLSADARSGAVRHGTAVGAQVVNAEVGRLAGPVNVLPLVTVRGALFGSEPGAVAEAVRHAARLGVPVINLSLNGRGDSSDGEVANAIRMATEAGSIVVTTAGNLARTSPQWPATMASDPTLPAHVRGRIIVVGCATEAGQQCRTSNRAGQASTRYILASGSDSIGAGAGEQLATHATSFAAPRVAALAATIATRRPDLAPEDVVATILQSADPVLLTDGQSAPATDVGNGLMNPLAALRQARIL